MVGSIIDFTPKEFFVPSLSTPSRFLFQFRGSSSMYRRNPKISEKHRDGIKCNPKICPVHSSVSLFYHHHQNQHIQDPGIYQLKSKVMTPKPAEYAVRISARTHSPGFYTDCNSVMVPLYVVVNKKYLCLL